MSRGIAGSEVGLFIASSSAALEVSEMGCRLLLIFLWITYSHRTGPIEAMGRIDGLLALDPSELNRGPNSRDRQNEDAHCETGIQRFENRLPVYYNSWNCFCWALPVRTASPNGRSKKTARTGSRNRGLVCRNQQLSSGRPNQQYLVQILTLLLFKHRCLRIDSSRLIATSLVSARSTRVPAIRDPDLRLPFFQTKRTAAERRDILQD